MTIESTSESPSESSSGPSQVINVAANNCTGPGTTCLAGAQLTINNPGTLPPTQAINVARNICSGGAFCQAQGIEFIGPLPTPP